MYLLDTDAISFLRRPSKAPQVAAWVGTLPPDVTFLSVITLGEIERGIQRQARQNPSFANDLRLWQRGLDEAFSGRILGFDAAAARIWGRLSHDLGTNSPDIMIAAIALANKAVMVTRNVRHFAPTGVEVVNPF